MRAVRMPGAGVAGPGRIGRRAVLGGALAVPAVAAPTGAAQPDAELVAWSVEYARLEAEYDQCCGSDGDEGPEPWASHCRRRLEEISARQDELRASLCDRAALTAVGVRAKALVVSMIVADGVACPIHADDDVTWSLVCDVLGRAEA